MIAFVLALGLSFGFGFYIGHPSQSLAITNIVGGKSVSDASGTIPSDLTLDADFNEFWDLWRLLKSKYYKPPIEEKKLFYGALAGMTASLGDPYTVFFEPKSAEEFNQALQGKFEGIGAEIGIKDDQLQVISPLTGMPAEKAGLRPGDWILKINGEDTSGMSVEKAVSLIRGAKGTTVTLTIGRLQAKKLNTSDVAIVRDTIVVKSVRVKYLKDGIAHVEITHFNEDTTDLFRAVAAEILTKDVKGIILDLRNDPGGYLDRATAVAGEWVGNQPVVMERAQEKITDRFNGVGSGRLQGIPTVVLVNQGSASAAEIVAGALQDYQVAKIVGMKTFGKGSVQDYVAFSDKSSVKITIAEWLTPYGRSIDKVGIEPDVKIDRTPEDINANLDPQLDKAVEILTGKPAKTVPSKTGTKR